MLTRYCILDLETVPADDCRQWLGTIEAPKHYVKEDTIAAYIRDETERRVQTAGLDAELCKIVALGLWPSKDAEPSVIVPTSEYEERVALNMAWAHITATCPMLGYGVSWFDAGVLVRRSQLLDVQVPPAFYKQGKYRHDMIVEIGDYLTLNGMIEQKKGRGLEYYCKRLGIDVLDDITGADIAALWAEGAHDAVRSHCLADLTRIRALAERLRVIEPLNHSASTRHTTDESMVL